MTGNVPDGGVSNQEKAKHLQSNLAAEHVSSPPGAAEVPQPTPPEDAPRYSWRKFQGWPWLIALLISSMTGIGALIWLSSLPPLPECKKTSTINLDSERLYCADQAARKGNAAALLSALKMASNWPKDHPLHAQANQLADEWSKSILVIARQKMEQGKLKEAVALARKVPQSSSVHAEAQTLIVDWEKDWQQGKAIFEKARFALKKQNWQQAIEQVKFLVQLDSDYWQQQAEDLVQQIATEKQAWNQLRHAQDLAAESTPESLTQAIQLASQIDVDRYAHDSVKTEINRWSKALVKIAQERWRAEDFQGAIAAAEKVPLDAAAAIDAQDLIQLSKAQALAKQDQLWSYLQARALAQQIARDRPLYQQAQDQIAEWESQIQNLGQIKLASLFANVDQIFTYQLAIDHAAMIQADQPRRIEAQTLIAQWRKKIETFEDRQYIALAKQFAAQGNTIEQLKAAIAEASKIQLGRALRVEAQTLVADWTRKIEQIEDQPILEKARTLAEQGQLEAAIQTAEEIPPGRALYPEAQRMVQNWVNQVQIAEDRPILDQAIDLASQGRLTEAIAKASQITSERGLYAEAQTEIGRWIAERDRIEAARQPEPPVPEVPETPNQDEFSTPPEATFSEPEALDNQDTPAAESSPPPEDTSSSDNTGSTESPGTTQ
jgi:soluble cytochrome b562